jgi:hypothetical protein
MPENGTKEISGGITIATTGIIIGGITTKTAGTGAGGLKDITLIVLSTSFTGSSKEDIGSIDTSIQIETIAANNVKLFHHANSGSRREVGLYG